jgi:hypothetical protein
LVSGYLFHLNCFNLISWCYIIHLKGGEKIKIGRQNNSEKKTPAWRWKDRFHRNTPTFDGYAAYVSRPTFEDLRRSDKVGERVFNAVCKLLKMRDNIEPLYGRHYDDNGLHSFAILFPEDKINCIAVMIGPFDVSDEMDTCKRGIMFHIIVCSANDVLPEMPVLEKQPKDIYVRDAPKSDKLDSESTAERMRKKWFEGVLKDENSKEISFYKNLNLDALDLSAARLLPSDVFISKSEDSTGFGYCRRFMTRQFNEVRLLGDPGKPNIEQTNTMNAYEFNKSSIMNINGRPGTGKSTILHMLTCESLLQIGPNLGKRRVLYLATTEELITEAKEEIKNLLEHLYLFDVDNLDDKLNKIFAGVDFATEEDFFMKAPGTLGPLDDVVAFKKCIAETDDDEDWNYWKEEENISLLQRILRNFVYGVFGSPSDFCKWVPNHRDVDAIRDLFERPFNFFEPGEKYIPGDDDLYSSDITPLYFWNPRFEEDPGAAAKRVGGLAKFLEAEGGLAKHLIDYSIGKTTGLWDPSGVIHGTATVMYEADELVDLYSSPLWRQMQTEGYDSIFIDESQDFSARTIAMLLQYFSNRGVRRDGNYLPFTFVCAGDEFQTIHGTLFQGAMIHINKIFTDWKMFLLKQSTGEMRSFADGLPNPAKISLRATYRTFDSAVDIIDNNVSQMREITLGEGHRRTVGTSNLGYTRTGVVAGLQASGEGRKYWDTVLTLLFTQLKETLDDEVVQTGVKVALIFPQKRIKQKDEICDQLKVFSNLEPKFKNVIDNMITRIDTAYLDIELKSTKTTKGEREEDANERVVAMVKEAGFYDIAAIKGQTHVAVVALQPPINPSNEKRWFDRLLDLSLSLVMVSRSQIGLFIAADDLDTEKIMGRSYEKFQYENNYYIDTCENSDFISRLENSAPPVISPEKLFAYALEEWHNPRGWARLEKSDGLSPDTRGFVNTISTIFQGARIKTGTIQSDFGKLEDLFEPEKRSNITAVIGNDAFFGEGAIPALRHFLHWQMISRELYEGGEGEELRRAIDELKSYWEENMPDVDEHTGYWMDLLFDEDNSAVELLIAGTDPWDLNQKLISEIPFPKECRVPRLKIGPWKFTAPPEAERKESWVSENQHWSPSIEVLQRVIKQTLAGKQNSIILRKVRWVLDYLGQDGQTMINTSLEDYNSGDSSTLGWVFRTTISNDGDDSPNAGLWFHDSLITALKKKLEDKDPLLLSAISEWLAGLEDASDIVRGLQYVENLIKDGTKKSKQLMADLYANLDSAVLVRWLEIENIGALNKVPREIIAIDGERSRELFAGINNLIESDNVKATSMFNKKHRTKIKTQPDFATSLFKVKIGSIGEDYERPLRQALKGYLMSIVSKLLSEPSASSHSGRALGKERNEEILNRLKKFDEWECPKDGGSMKKDEGLQGVPRRKCNVCGYTRRLGIPDESVEWFRDFNDAAPEWVEFGSLISSIQENIRSARDARFQYLMGNIRNGKKPFTEQFQTRDAEVINIGSSRAWPYWEDGVGGGEQWRSSGHLFDWNILGRERGINEVPAARFADSGKLALALNGKTFDGYMATWRGENDLAYKSFIEGGAIPESQVMLLKSIPLEGGVTRLLNDYCKAMMLESRIYLTHVNRRARVPTIGASWKWKSLPPDILEEYKIRPKDGQFGVQPYITQMNQYFELHAFLETMKLCVKENGEAALAACMDEGIGVAVYRKDAFSDVLEDENNTLKAKSLDSYLIEDIREVIICSSKEATFNRGKIISDFILLLEGYRRASEEGDVNIYLETIMKVIGAPGLQRVFVESSEGGYELDDTSKKIDARGVLLQYLEELDIFSPAMINHILQQLEAGKREDGIFSDAGEEVSEAYELFCSSALEEE